MASQFSPCPPPNEFYCISVFDMDSNACRHADVREFDGLRSCLGCGETRFREDVASTDQVQTEQEYIYTDLRCLERGRTIRLVVLAPGDHDDPICCTLVLSGMVHSEYDAVSYTWATEDGDDSKSHILYVDGSVMKVTQNCHSALRQLRHTGSHRRLWIDAICINQSNVKERNHQVGVMDRIYRAANVVHVCINDEAHIYSAGMGWLSKDGNPQTMTPVEREQLLKLTQCRYFSRVWIIQEIVLAKSIVLHINGLQIGLTRSVVFSLSSTVGTPGPLRERISPTSSKCLSTQMKKSIKCSCSDQRDHVYAILSLLAPDIRDLIPTDYSLSVEQVYTNLLFACISTSQTLDILAYAAKVAADQNSSVTSQFTIEHFHSFIVNEESLEEFHHFPEKWKRYIRFTSEPGIQASSQIWLLPSPVHEHRMLPGFKVTVHCVQLCNWSSRYSIFNVERIYLNLLNHPSVITHEFSGSPPPLPMDRLTTERTLKAIRKLKNPARYAWQVFGTSQGVGMSKVEALQGDRICYVDGMRVQLLLRRIEGTKHRIVSTCYWEPIESESHMGPGVDPYQISTEVVELY
ncbi:hypothetical protein OPT61_g8258 [Boeremia exigua]|uniref:Uncharacterized protein n=1 Tax=Boeremia exigua TaxID=749465 RepID=A0ACC2HZC5_9PLEO|nr:hypothetical protein OPT61_g8258 [Boeremia exigua]